MSAPTIIGFLRDPNLFGALDCFRDLSSWAGWIVLLKAVYGLPLSENEIGVFKQFTGRSYYDPPPGGWSEVIIICGRQSGKTRTVSVIGAYEGITASPEPDGTSAYVLLIAQDIRGAQRVLLDYVKAALNASPILRDTVEEELRETTTIKTGTKIACYPCRPEAIRGLRARVAICDELAFYRTNDYRPVDKEMIRSIRPALAMTNGKLIIISSPYAQTGALWELHRKHYGRDASSVLVWQADAPSMNPKLSSGYLARMEEEDPEAFRSEVLGQFRAGLSTLLDPEAIDSCVASGRRELPPVSGTNYEAFTDPSGGRADSFTVAIGHRDGERGVIDLVRGWGAPFNPSGVVEEIAEVLRGYRIHKIVGDRYAGEWPREKFRENSITYDLADKPKSDLYLALVSEINSGRIELPDVPELLREFRGLERRRGPSGRDRVDHRPGAHDDLANAVAGVSRMILTGRAPGDFGITVVFAGLASGWALKALSVGAACTSTI